MGSRCVDIYELRETLMENQRNYFFDSPKLSVVVKTHNDETKIIKCLQALSNQTAEEIEVLVIDDNSTDATYSLACTYSEVDNRVKVFRNKKDLDISELVGSNKVITISAKKIVNKRFAENILNNKSFSKVFYSKTEGKNRTIYNILGIKITSRKNKLSDSEYLNLNSEFENGKGSVPKVKSKYETLDELISTNKSIVRYGDGEFNLIFGEDLPFQKYNANLSNRLSEILKATDENIMIAIPDVFASLKEYNESATKFWRKFVVTSRKDIYSKLDLEKQYYDTEATRPYMDLVDKSKVGDYFKKFKQVWNNRDIVFVEGEASRLGFNNDLFDNAKSIKRILCPAKNAFDKYEEILNECKKQSKDVLFVVALGPTATVLAYDLSKLGYRALDLGHIDIEYEWFRLKATKKIAIPNKYVNEAKKGKQITSISDETYSKQVICNLANAKNNKKIFLVFNTACFGDVLLCNSLCQNIKKIYPDSFIVFVVDKNWYEVAKYQEGVDDVIIFDKNATNKGLKGLFNFIKDFKYKNIYASFITYRNERNYIISKLLNCKHIVVGKHKLPYSVQEKHCRLLSKITKEEIINYPIKYNLPDDVKKNPIANEMQDKQYITLCCVSKNPIKDMPIETAVEFINKVNKESNYKVVLVGAGKQSEQYAKELEQANCNFVNLVNKTTLLELGKVLKDSKCLVSVDTGTMHFGYALNVPTVAIFYNIDSVSDWAPSPKLYNTITLCSNQSAENIFNSLENLLNDERQKEKKLSVVIPTLQKEKKLLVNLLSNLEKDSSVDEIILIDNSLKGLDYTNSKLRVIIPNENLYVNPSWNIGVRESKNDIVALLNDDITIAPDFCSNVVKTITPQMGVVGACLNDIEETTKMKMSVENTDFSFTPIDLITYHWGISMFFYKSSYFEIPEDMKVFRGDDWLFYKNKELGRQNYYIDGQKIYHYGSLSSNSKFAKKIGRIDRKKYRKYMGKKWYNFIFDVDRLSDGYRLTLFGLKIFLPNETSQYKKVK